MKLLIRKNKLARLFLLICSLLWADNFYSQNCMSFANEENFDLTPHETSVQSATAAIRDFTTYVRRKANNNPYNILAAEIPTTALCVLKEDAEALKTTGAGTACTRYMTAVNLIIGVQNTNITLFYQPVLLCFTGTVTQTQGAATCTNAEFSAIYSTHYYKYNGSTFTSITNAPGTEVNPSITTYTNGMKIDRLRNGTFSNYTPAYSGSDLNGDTKSVIYTFREMMKVSTDNASDSIKIWSDIRLVNNGTSNLTKHSLILSGKDSNGTNSIFYSPGFVMEGKFKALASRYANLAHLCPPNCQSLTYQISCQ